MCAPAPFQSPEHRLRRDRHRDAEVLGDAVEQPARDPQLVRDVERAQRADLELPLAGHDLGVDAGDADAGLDAGVHVRLDDLTAEDLVGADAAVVEALRGGVAAEREAERATVLEEVVLLLDAEQRLLVCELLRDRHELGAVVGDVRRHVDVEHLAHDELVVAAADRVRDTTTTGRSTQSDLSPGAWFVLEPSKPQIGRSALVRQDLRLGPEACRRLRAVDPDVLGLVRHVMLLIVRAGCGGPAVTRRRVSSALCRRRFGHRRARAFSDRGFGSIAEM